MKHDRIYLSPPNVGKDELEGVSSVLQSGWVAPVGPALDEFECQLGELFSGKEVLAVNSGTAALHLALKLCGVSDGDRVLTSSFTFAACANVILYERAIPVLLDSEDITWNMDPNVLSNYLSGCKILPKAIIITHLYGMPGQMNQILQVAKNFNIKVIEDAAEALGAKLNSKNVGGLADYGILSFNGNKIITTSGGGALICTDAERKSALHLATQANSSKHGYDHHEVGYNYRMSNILAGLGLKQLTRLEEFIAKKRTIFERYRDALNSSFDFLEEPEEYQSNRWLSTALLKDNHVNVNELIQYLADQNIESRELWKPLHLHGAYSKYDFIGEGICKKIYQKGICLPSGTGLSEEDQEIVIDQIRRWVNQ